MPLTQQKSSEAKSLPIKIQIFAEAVVGHDAAVRAVYSLMARNRLCPSFSYAYDARLMPRNNHARMKGNDETDGWLVADTLTFGNAVFEEDGRLLQVTSRQRKGLVLSFAVREVSPRTGKSSSAVEKLSIINKRKTQRRDRVEWRTRKKPVE
jgi:hypothetical protein